MLQCIYDRLQVLYTWTIASRLSSVYRYHGHFSQPHTLTLTFWNCGDPATSVSREYLHWKGLPLARPHLVVVRVFQLLLLFVSYSSCKFTPRGGRTAPVDLAPVDLAPKHRNLSSGG